MRKFPTAGCPAGKWGGFCVPIAVLWLIVNIVWLVITISDKETPSVKLEISIGLNVALWLLNYCCWPKKSSTDTILRPLADSVYSSPKDRLAGEEDENDVATGDLEVVL
jgi:hypothetical protein